MENSMNSFSKMGNALKDPFKQRGGTFGLAIIAIAVLLVVFNIGAIYTFAQSLLGAVLCFAAVGVILYVAFDKNFRLALSTWYMLQVKKMLGAIIKMDPISILENAIKKMYKKIDEMESNMGKLNGVRGSLKEKIEAKKEELDECVQRAKVAEKQGKTDLALIEKRQIARLTGLVSDYIDLSTSAEKWYLTMSKIAEMAKLYAQDFENEVSAQKEKYKIIKLSHSAFKSAMSVIKGDPDELAIYNQAFEYVNDTIMERLGEMDRVVNSAGGLLDKIDVQKEMFGIKGDDLISKYNEMGIEGMFESLKTAPIGQFDSYITGKNIEKEAVKITITQPNQSSNSKYL